MSQPIKINYLSKDELTFEYILKLGKPPVAYSVENLRKSLRTCIKNNIKSDPKHLAGLVDFKKEQLNLETKLSLLTQDLDEAKDAETPMLNIARFQAKILHYSNRIKVLKQFKMEDRERAVLDKYTDKISKIEEQFNTIKAQVDEQELNTFEINLDVSMEEEDDLSSTLVSVTEKRINDNNPNPDTNQTSTIKDLTPTEKPILPIGLSEVSSDGDTSLNLGLSAKPNISAKSDSVTPCSLTKTNPEQIQTNATSLLSYDKLPNPLNKYLHDFKTTNGLNIPDLLHFIKAMLSLKSEAHLSDSDILSVLQNYAEGPLLMKLIQCRQEPKPSLNTFHAIVIDSFLPFTLKEKLKQDFVFRPQLHGESLYSYVKDIKLHHDILLCNMSECSLVELIRGSLCPEVRNKLVFQPSPSTFAQLEQLCIGLINVEYQDLVRTQINCYQTRPSNVGPSNIRPIRPSNDVRVCYNCQSPGHLSRNCLKPRTGTGNHSKN